MIRSGRDLSSEISLFELEPVDLALSSVPSLLSPLLIDSPNEGSDPRATLEQAREDLVTAAKQTIEKIPNESVFEPLREHLDELLSGSLSSSATDVRETAFQYLFVKGEIEYCASLLQIAPAIEIQPADVSELAERFSIVGGCPLVERLQATRVALDDSLGRLATELEEARAASDYSPISKENLAELIQQANELGELIDEHAAWLVSSLPRSGEGGIDQNVLSFVRDFHGLKHVALQRFQMELGGFIEEIHSADRSGAVEQKAVPSVHAMLQSVTLGACASLADPLSLPCLKLLDCKGGAIQHNPLETHFEGEAVLLLRASEPGLLRTGSDREFLPDVMEDLSDRFLLPTSEFAPYEARRVISSTGPFGDNTFVVSEIISGVAPDGTVYVDRTQPNRETVSGIDYLSEEATARLASKGTNLRVNDLEEYCTNSGGRLLVLEDVYGNLLGFGHVNVDPETFPDKEAFAQIPKDLLPEGKAVRVNIAVISRDAKPIHPQAFDQMLDAFKRVAIEEGGDYIITRFNLDPRAEGWKAASKRGFELVPGAYTSTAGASSDSETREIRQQWGVLEFKGEGR